MGSIESFERADVLPNKSKTIGNTLTRPVENALLPTDFSQATLFGHLASGSMAIATMPSKIQASETTDFSSQSAENVAVEEG